MHCEQARAAIVDRLIEGAAANGELDEHLAGCAECRTFRDESRALWSGLAELPAPAPTRAAADARARFQRALEREAGKPSRRWTTRRVMLVAAGWIIAALIGYGFAHRPTSADNTPRYLLLLYDTPLAPGVTPPSDAAMSAIIAEYSAWARGLRAEGRLVSAEKLRDDATWLGGAAPPATDDRVGGFFVIRAKTPAEARAIAESCPHLKHHGRVELRAIHPT